MAWSGRQGVEPAGRLEEVAVRRHNVAAAGAGSRRSRDVMTDDAVAEVMALERRLLRPEVRASAEALESLLDAEYREIGASGRLWTRDSVMQALPEEQLTEPVRDEDMEGRRLADDLVLLTYVSDAAGRRARRTSLWQQDQAGRWRLLHHQGTLLPSDSKAAPAECC